MKNYHNFWVNIMLMNSLKFNILSIQSRLWKNKKWIKWIISWCKVVKDKFNNKWWCNPWPNLEWEVWEWEECKWCQEWVECLRFKLHKWYLIKFQGDLLQWVLITVCKYNNLPHNLIYLNQLAFSKALSY